jgi:hypothetical protein
MAATQCYSCIDITLGSRREIIRLWDNMQSLERDAKLKEYVCKHLSVLISVEKASADRV